MLSDVKNKTDWVVLINVFEEELEELAPQIIEGRVDVLSDVNEAPDKPPDEYQWFSVLDGGADGLTKEDVTTSYTAQDVPNRGGVIVISIWKRPNNAYYVHGTIGDRLHEKYKSDT